MENFDWKRYLLVLTIAFGLFMLYDYFVLSKQLAAEKPSSNQTAAVQNPPVQQTSAVVPLFLGTEREKLKPSDFVVIDGEKAKVKVALEGAKIVSFYDKRFKRELVEPYERNYNIYPLEILTSDWNTTKVLNFEKYDCTKKDNTLECRLNAGKIKALKKFTFTEGGYLARVEIKLEGVENPYLFVGMTPNEDPFFTHVGPIFKTSTGQVIRIEIEEIETPRVLHGDFVWSGQEGRYFLKAVNYETKTAVVYRISYADAEGNTKYTSATLVALQPTSEISYLVGPKEFELLKKLNFVEAIDFGELSFLAYPLFLVLYFFYKLTHSWVASIFILTLIIRIIFFPLSISSVRSMKKMQELAPKIEQIRKKYSKDPQRMQQELLKLYKETGFNPFGGCLPILIQIPIFFALYKVLIVTPDLALEGFLWIPSLADKDPYFILPVIMGLTMVAQTWITPSPNQQQNFMMYLMAAVFTFLFATFPAGLVLYWTLNNIFNIIQTWIVYKYLS